MAVHAKTGARLDVYHAKQKKTKLTKKSSVKRREKRLEKFAKKV